MPATTLTSLISGIRSLVEDDEESFTDLNTYTSSSIFTLSESNAISVEEVRINGVATSNYTYSSTTQKVTISDSMSVGDTIEIDFKYYNNYSDSNIEKYTKSALIHISTRQYKDFEIIGTSIYPEPDKIDTKLIMMVASILIDPPKKQLRLPDLTINYADTLSKSELIDRTVSIFKKDSTGVFALV